MLHAALPLAVVATADALAVPVVPLALDAPVGEAALVAVAVREGLLALPVGLSRLPLAFAHVAVGVRLGAAALELAALEVPLVRGAVAHDEQPLALAVALDEAALVALPLEHDLRALILEVCAHVDAEPVPRVLLELAHVLIPVDIGIGPLAPALPVHPLAVVHVAVRKLLVPALEHLPVGGQAPSIFGGGH